MKSWITTQALSLALPIIIGLIVFPCVQLLKRCISTLDQANPAVKQAVAIALSFLLAGVAHFLGDALPGVCILGDDGRACLEALTNTDAMKTLIAAVLAMLIHAGQKRTE